MSSYPFRIVCSAFVLLIAARQPLFAADWPMWRCDAGRTAASTAELPQALHLLWPSVLH